MKVSSKYILREGFVMPNEATTIAFPLRGEWYTETSPADRIPSH